MIYSGQSNSRDKIIQLLSSANYLTAKQIHFGLKRQFSTSISYQATHKTLKQMLDDNVVIKQKSNYSINPEWVDSYRKNAELLAENLRLGLNELKIQDLQENESIHLTFKGILDVGWFIIDKLMNVPNPKKSSCLALWRFCYSVVGLDSKHLDGLKQGFEKNKWFAFIEENNKLDHVFGDTLISYGLKQIKYGVKSSTKLSDKMIIGSYICEINYPSSFRKLWELQNRLPQKIAEFNLAKHILYMREFQPTIEVTLTKNDHLANEYRIEYLNQSG